MVSLIQLAGKAQITPDPLLSSQIVDRYAEHIFYSSGATGMALVAIHGNQRVFASFGETRPGNNVRPQKDSLIRIASLSKLLTSEVMVKMAERGQIRLDDPLSKYAPPGADLCGPAPVTTRWRPSAAAASTLRQMIWHAGCNSS